MQVVNGSKLQLICVAAGRDGTMSVAHMIQEIYDSIGGGRVQHEYCAGGFYDAFCYYREAGNPANLTEIQQMIDACPWECIVGNGYAPVLPIFAERLSDRKLSLIHLRRTDRDACVASLKANAEFFPMGHGNYVPSSELQSKRIAAFHFGEMTKLAWEALTLTEKFQWYYDKTHSLVESSQRLFDKFLDLRTEELDLPETRQKLAQFVANRAMDQGPRSVRLNAHMIDTATVPREHWPKMQWLLGRLDQGQLATDDAYAVEYFLRTFTELMNAEIGDPGGVGSLSDEKRRKLSATLERAYTAVMVARERIESFQAIAGVA